MNELDRFLKWWATLPNPDPKMRYTCLESWQEATFVERERAAKVCEDMVRTDKHGYPDYPSSYAQECADAIREGEAP